jgi:ferritin-like metal-binding protein YciE
MKSIKQQFLFDLADIYDAENRIAKALPKMIKTDTSPELKQAILAHAREIECHVTKVEEIFECFGETVNGSSTKSMDELLAEGMDAEAEFIDSLNSASDLITALQKVEPHGVKSFRCQREWEIASYGCLNDWAGLLGSAEGADLLEKIIEEEHNDPRLA